MFVKDDTVILADIRLFIKNTKENIKYLTTLNVIISVISTLITFFLL